MERSSSCTCRAKSVPFAPRPLPRMCVHSLARVCKRHREGRGGAPEWGGALSGEVRSADWAAGVCAHACPGSMRTCVLGAKASELCRERERVRERHGALACCKSRSFCSEAFHDDGERSWSLKTGVTSCPRTRWAEPGFVRVRARAPRHYTALFGTRGHSRVVHGGQKEWLSRAATCCARVHARAVQGEGTVRHIGNGSHNRGGGEGRA